MAKKILLIGRKPIIIENAKAKFSHLGLDLEIYGGTSIDDVRSTFASVNKVDHVFMGAGVELEARLAIVKEVFQSSNGTTIHLKDADSGPEGFVPFVGALLDGLHKAGL